MMICCYVAGIVCSVALVGWALIRDKRCGAWLLLMVAISGGMLWSLGAPCHDGGMSGMNSDLAGYCGTPPPELIAAAAARRANLPDPVHEQQLNQLRWSALWSTLVSSFAALTRGLFLIATVRREETLLIVRTVIRFIWHKVLRLKSTPPCCAPEVNAAIATANAAPTAGISIEALAGNQRQ